MWWSNKCLGCEGDGFEVKRLFYFFWVMVGAIIKRGKETAGSRFYGVL
jgi:hypothetical protein